MSKRKRKSLSFEEANKLLYYNEITGLLFSRVEGHQRKVGTVLGSKQSNGTLGVSIYGKLYAVHRLCWLLKTGKWPKHQVRQKNGIKTDNSWENLEEITTWEKAKRQCRNEVAGVSFVNKTKRWKATVSEKGNQKFLGEYEDLTEAVFARLAGEECLGVNVDHEKSARQWIRRNL